MSKRNDPLELPVRFTLAELAKIDEEKDPKTLHPIQNCSFLSAHYSFGILGSILTLNEVTIPYTDKEGWFMVNQVRVNIRSNFIVLRHDPNTLGLKVDLLLEKPIMFEKMDAKRFFGRPPTEDDLKMPPNMLAAEGLVIRFQDRDDLDQWDISLKLRRALDDAQGKQRLGSLIGSANQTSYRPRPPQV